MTDPMITTANTLETSSKPPYGPHKASERYLDYDDSNACRELVLLFEIPPNQVTERELLQALETLCTHLRKKYYAG